MLDGGRERGRYFLPQKKRYDARVILTFDSRRLPDGEKLYPFRSSLLTQQMCVEHPLAHLHVGVRSRAQRMGPRVPNPAK